MDLVGPVGEAGRDVEDPHPGQAVLGELLGRDCDGHQLVGEHVGEPLRRRDADRDQDQGDQEPVAHVAGHVLHRPAAVVPAPFAGEAEFPDGQGRCEWAATWLEGVPASRV